MLALKTIADFFTYLRVVLACLLVYLGWVQGGQALPLVIWSMIVSWTSDSLDGPLARRSQPYKRTWIGDHDLEVDMLVSIGLLVYMLLAGMVPLALALMYAVAALIVLLHYGMQPSLGMLFQAPIYGWFIMVATRLSPATGSWMVGWIIAIMIITWPRFPQEVVPGFLQDLGTVIKNDRSSGS